MTSPSADRDLRAFLRGAPLPEVLAASRAARDAAFGQAGRHRPT
jgi:hypothetical protein